MDNKSNESCGFSSLVGLTSDINTFQQDEYVDNRLDRVLPKRDIIKISSFKQLCKIGKDNAYPLYGHYELTRDIDASPSRRMNEGKGFEPIGNNDDVFTGIFDGKGFKIFGLYINRPEEDYVGLFRSIDIYDKYNLDFKAEIIGVNLSVDRIIGKNLVGGLVGFAESSAVITNCYVNGDVNGNNNVGGLVGCLIGASITNTHANVSVCGQNGVGCLVGNGNGDIFNCYADGNVRGGDSVGGLVGAIESYGEIISCYANGNVRGDDYVGGLLGSCEHGKIFNCYADGDVSGSDHIGGLIGYIWGDSIINCYANVVMCGYCDDAGGLLGYDDDDDDRDVIVTDCFYDVDISGTTESAGGIGKTTEEMKQQNTYENWDFENVWQVNPKSGYPYLRELGIPVFMSQKHGGRKDVSATMLKGNIIKRIISKIIPYIVLFILPSTLITPINLITKGRMQGWEEMEYWQWSIMVGSVFYGLSLFFFIIAFLGNLGARNDEKFTVAQIARGSIAITCGGGAIIMIANSVWETIKIIYELLQIWIYSFFPENGGYALLSHLIIIIPIIVSIYLFLTYGSWELPIFKWFCKIAKKISKMTNDFIVGEKKRIRINPTCKVRKL